MLKNTNEYRRETYANKARKRLNVKYDKPIHDEARNKDRHLKIIYFNDRNDLMNRVVKLDHQYVKNEHRMPIPIVRKDRVNHATTLESNDIRRSSSSRVENESATVQRDDSSKERKNVSSKEKRQRQEERKTEKRDESIEIGNRIETCTGIGKYEVRYINTITVSSKREIRTKFDNDIREVEPYQSDAEEYDYDCDESIEEAEERERVRERIRLANEKWNELDDAKVEVAEHNRNVKFHKNTKTVESPIAHRKDWSEKLHKQHKREGRLQKYKQMRELENDDNYELQIVESLDDATNNDKSRKITLEVADKKRNKSRRMRTEEILNDLDESLKEGQVGTSREPVTPIIRVKFDACETNALIDTGADISAITRQLYDELNATTDILDILPVRKFILRGAFSERGAIISNKVKLAFTYDNARFEHEFFIVQRMSEKMILGVDFIKKFKMTIEYDDATKIKFGNDETSQFRIINNISISQAEDELQSIIYDNENVFSEGIGKVNHYKHEIRVKHNEPFKKKSYPIPEKYMREVSNYIVELEEQGIITKQQTPFINPLVVVIKKNGNIRLCLDARELNKRMVDDFAQPPTIEEVFRRTGCNGVYSSIDISHAFWQIPLTKESRQYTGFMFNGQSYVFKRMPFGIKTAGASFTRAMAKALGTEAAEYMKFI